MTKKIKEPTGATGIRIPLALLLKVEQKAKELKTSRNKIITAALVKFLK
jgi:hypothetical protein